MRKLVTFVLAGFGFAATAAAQTSCTPGALTTAAKQVVAIRHQLHTVTVGENEPHVPGTVATGLQGMKAALNDAADAVFTCAKPEASPEELQTKLAEALHANLSQASETTLVTREKQDEGAYGSDLAVQVFPLYSSPRYFEVDFRYGVECGDDNLLIVYQANGPAGAGWRPVLRWGAPAYSTVGDAFGDFVLLTPLSGFQGDRNWRFVVAHGEPQCTAETARSHFDLDLLQPTTDPAHPETVWHLQQAYTRNQVPRLSTTEDTLTFQLNAPEKAKTPVHADTYRFRVTKENQVSPLATELPPAQAAKTNSPQ